ncbi:unnamed protein product, partial [Prunus brigantina]
IRGSPLRISLAHPHLKVPPQQSSTTLRPSQFTKVKHLTPSLSLARQRLTPFEGSTISVLSSHKFSPNKVPHLLFNTHHQLIPITTIHGMRWF